MNLGVEVMAGGVRGGTSILFAALGETLAERAGIVNLGVEGSMLGGALAGYAVAAQTGNPWLGVVGGALAGGLLSAVHAFFVIDRKANQLATGLVVLFLALGLTSLFGSSWVSKPSTPFSVYAVPGLSHLPILGPILFEQDPLTYISFLLVPVTWFFLFRSRPGLLLRGAGERTEVLAAYGIPARRIQYLAVVAGGMLAGVGGAQLSTAYAHAWFEGMVQGRGFVAVAVVIFASRQPFKVAGGSYLFGAALALSPALQARGIGVNQFALAVLPYVVTIAVLVIVGKRGAREAPEGLRKVFEISPSG